METIDSIPVGKVKRASKIIETGAKVGVNYLRYYGDQLINDKKEARERLDHKNADDIYQGLKKLKGSALKVAQMLSMDKNVLPSAYVEKFSLAQFSVPPLSPALVLKTFRERIGKTPLEIFDKFDLKSVHAASIGQVHLAEKEGKKLAVKIQYPGVAESIGSDLALVKPIAIKMFNIQGEGSDEYFQEVEDKLIEETDYQMEVKSGMEVIKDCAHIPGLKFPNYYPEWSSDRFITMDWMTGVHLSEFTRDNKDPEAANHLGQALWDFYMYQLHIRKQVQADPHPGNFLVSSNLDLIALDFGCMKQIPDEFYNPYFELAEKESLANHDLFERNLYKLEILREDDSGAEIEFFKSMFHELLSLFTKPFHQEYFDFSNEKFFSDISRLGEQYAKNTELKKMNGNRGSKHFIYINRTFFGLYNLMHLLKSDNIRIRNFESYVMS